jgi:hypothetical protein
MKKLTLLASVLLLVQSPMWAASAKADGSVGAISHDPYDASTSTTDPSQHATEVEADTFSYGQTVVSAFQVGRYKDGGSTDIGWATSLDGGKTWTNGYLPGLTVAVGGTNLRASDASVAYSLLQNVWIISTLPIGADNTAGVAVSRSPDGMNWDAPVWVTQVPGLDKNWTVCDNWPSSPYFGTCYTEWDDTNNILFMSSSTDGGLTWSQPQSLPDQSAGIGGQPLVRPDGMVVVPYVGGDETGPGEMRVFRSTDGGASWTASELISDMQVHDSAGKLRNPALPTAEIDLTGQIYLVWQDCRFRAGCTANDLVLSTSSDGMSWSTVARIPIDPVQSGVDHFTPGLGVDLGTGIDQAHLGLTYYYYDDAACADDKCAVNVGFVSSLDSGQHWSSPTKLAGPMLNSWFPETTQGRMYGDYLSTSFVDGEAISVFGIANAPTSAGTYDVAMSAPLGGGMKLDQSPGSPIEPYVGGPSAARAHKSHRYQTLR